MYDIILVNYNTCLFNLYIFYDTSILIFHYWDINFMKVIIYILRVGTNKLKVIYILVNRPLTMFKYALIKFNIGNNYLYDV